MISTPAAAVADGVFALSPPTTYTKKEIQIQKRSSHKKITATLHKVL